MRRYDLVIFDFDGTLADSSGWFRLVFNDVAKRHGFRPASDDELESLRGRPTREILRALGVPFWKVPLIANTMREMVARDAEKITPFDGARDLLAQLSERKIALGLVTSNAEANVRRILGEEASSHIRWFSCGVSLFGKAARFRALAKASGFPPDRILAIGDETRDIEAARQAGIAAGTVIWGYATPAILRSGNPDHIFESMDEIRDIMTI